MDPETDIEQKGLCVKDTENSSTLDPNKTLHTGKHHTCEEHAQSSMHDTT